MSNKVNNRQFGTHSYPLLLGTIHSSPQTQGNTHSQWDQVQLEGHEWAITAIVQYMIFTKDPKIELK